MEEYEEFLRESNAIEGVYDDDSLKQAKYAFHYLIGRRNLTVGTILRVHKLLMLNQPLLPDQKGYLRHINVYVGDHRCPDWHLVRLSLDRWVKQASELTDPIKDHVDFERIHPFVDGNGRTGRMLMNWAFLKKGEPIKVFTEAEKYEYYKLFN